MKKRNSTEDRKFLINEEPTITSIKPNKSGELRIFINLTKSFIGAASFELPWAFRQSGLFGGAIGIIILAFIANYTIRILTKCSHITARRESVVDPTYAQVGRSAFGRVGEIIVYLSIILMNIGICGSYLIFIGQNLEELLHPYWNGFSHRVIILLLLPILLTFSLLRNYKFLAPSSVLGCMALLTSMAVVYGYGFSEGVLPYDQLAGFRWETYPLFFGNAVFLFNIHSVVIPIEQSMNDQKKMYYFRVLDFSMVFVTLLNMAFAFICYGFWGDNTAGIIIQNLPPGALVNVIKVLLCLDLLCTYAIFLLPMAELIEKLLFVEPEEWGFISKHSLKCAILRFIFVLLTVGIGLALDKFQLATGLVGGLTSTIVGFILPSLIFLKFREGNTFDYVACGFIVVLGAIAAFLSAYQSIKGIIEALKHG